ncbi:hypothetical protein HRbin30_01921 [bacterium HR30]|nr:hypothetical protein HRbin30_01921 [bacterium HR30]
MTFRMMSFAVAWLWLGLSSVAVGEAVDWTEYFPNDPLAHPQQRIKGAKRGSGGEAQKSQNSGPEPSDQDEPSSSRPRAGAQKENTGVVTRKGGGTESSIEGEKPLKASKKERRKRKNTGQRSERAGQ